MEIRFVRLYSSAVIPNYAHDGDSGVDLFSIEDKILNPGESALIKTGIALEIPLGYEAQVRPRSGLALKHSITVLNTPGTIDAGYRGEIGVILINHGTNWFQVTAGMKIAQLVFAPVVRADLIEVNELSDTVRGVGGFGSTGI